MGEARVTKEHGIASIVLGAIEIVIGTIITVCSFVLQSKVKSITSNLTPYWAGIAFIVPGIFGIVAGVTKNRCAMIFFMILNIVAFVIEGVACIFIGLVMMIWTAYSNMIPSCTYDQIRQICTCKYNGEERPIGGMESCEVLSTVNALLYTIVIFLVIAALVTLACSILGCISVCCTHSNTGQTTTVVVQADPSAIPLQQKQPPAYIQ